MGPSAAASDLRAALGAVKRSKTGWPARTITEEEQEEKDGLARHPADQIWPTSPEPLLKRRMQFQFVVISNQNGQVLHCTAKSYEKVAPIPEKNIQIIAVQCTQDALSSAALEAAAMPNCIFTPLNDYCEQ